MDPASRPEVFQQLKRLRLGVDAFLALTSLRISLWFCSSLKDLEDLGRGELVCRAMEDH